MKTLNEVLLTYNLTAREMTIVELVSRGNSNIEVAEKLNLSEKTVKFHLTNIYNKMSISSRARLIVFCLPYLLPLGA